MNRKNEITTHHVMPIDGKTLAQIERWAHLHGNEDVGRKMSKTADTLNALIIDAGYATFGWREANAIMDAKRKRGNARGGDDIVLTYGLTDMAWADIDGAAGAILANLAREWHMSREDTLARCIPADEAARRKLEADKQRAMQGEWRREKRTARIGSRRRAA